MINNVCIIDLETTGLDPEKDDVIEVGAILYSVKHQTTLEQFSCLFGVKENPMESINRIPTQSTWEGSDLRAKDLLYGFLERSDYFVAHNKEFDSKWPLLDFVNVPWLCSFSDFIWPRNSKPSNLIATCLNHGIGVTKAHRALSDCQLIAELFDRTEDLQGLFERAIAMANEPRYLIIAQVDYDSRQLAKDFNFYWEFYKDTP